MQNLKNSKDPLHGITLQMILRDVIDLHGYKELAQMTKINKFDQDDHPTMKPILKFLRKTPWARAKVESIYVRDLKKMVSKREKDGQKI